MVRLVELATPYTYGEGTRRDCVPDYEETCDYIAGNPPWIVWDHLPAAYREATKPLWEHYGLFTLSATAARHGGGKKDLAMLMLYASADRYLKPGGRLGLVMTQTLFQTKGAGDGFRRFRIGTDGDWLGVLHVDDLVGFQPFEGAANWTATILLEKGRPTAYPVPYVKWRLVDRLPGAADPDWRACFTTEPLEASPVDPQKLNSPWRVQPRGLKVDLAAIMRPSEYTAHAGACSGGANGVYWLRILKRQPKGVLVENLAERGKKAVARLQRVLEPDRLYPLVRWGDVAPFRATPSCYLLLAQDAQTRRGIDEAALRAQCPQTYAYLCEFEGLLRDRVAYRRYQGRAAFYSMYDVGPYTVAPIKLVWRRMDRRITAAVVEPIHDPHLGCRVVIPQETCVLVATESREEAHYLCAVMNSAAANFLARSFSVQGGKGFGTPGMLDYLGLRRFDPGDPRHGRLATLSQQAHAAALRGEDGSGLQRAIDELAAGLYGLRPGDLEQRSDDLTRP